MAAGAATGSAGMVTGDLLAGLDGTDAILPGSAAYPTVLRPCVAETHRKGIVPGALGGPVGALRLQLRLVPLATLTPYRWSESLPAQVVNPRNFSVAPVSVVGQVITWNLTNVADGSTITYTASIAAGTVTGSYKNVAVITQGPCVADECTDDSVVNTGQVEEATGTPTVTPPATDTLPSESGQAGSSLLLILFAMTGLVAVLGVLTPVPARVRRQRRRG